MLLFEFNKNPLIHCRHVPNELPDRQLEGSLEHVDGFWR